VEVDRSDSLPEVRGNEGQNVWPFNYRGAVMSTFVMSPIGDDSARKWLESSRKTVLALKPANQRELDPIDIV